MSQQTKIGKRATSIYTEDSYTRVRYHSTEVVKFNEKEIILNSGGWWTNTTKTRINQAAATFALGISVFQKDFEWFVRTNNGVVMFVDGMVISRVS
jgi:hypothetical protein